MEKEGVGQRIAGNQRSRGDRALEEGECPDKVGLGYFGIRGGKYSKKQRKRNAKGSATSFCWLVVKREQLFHKKRPNTNSGAA